MIFGWFKARRRRDLQAAPFPDVWEEICRRNVAAWRTLSEDERARLRQLVQIFVSEKNWEGCGGLEITDEIRVTIAAEACLLLLELEHDYYPKVRSILVYPSTYLVPGATFADGGIQSEEGRAILGLAAHGGPVVLAWDETLHGSRNPQDGQNLVYHEFAHKLDMLDGWVDGTPPLRSRAQAEAWQRVMTAEFERLRAATEEGQATLLDPYGATNPGEFFAVATEWFFEQALALKAEHPELYGVLLDHYRQDPARRGEP